MDKYNNIKLIMLTISTDEIEHEGFYLTELDDSKIIKDACEKAVDHILKRKNEHGFNVNEEIDEYLKALGFLPKIKEDIIIE